MSEDEKTRMEFFVSFAFVLPGRYDLSRPLRCFAFFDDSEFCQVRLYKYSATRGPAPGELITGWRDPEPVDKTKVTIRPGKAVFSRGDDVLIKPALYTSVGIVDGVRTYVRGPFALMDPQCDSDPDRLCQVSVGGRPAPADVLLGCHYLAQPPFQLVTPGGGLTVWFGEVIVDCYMVGSTGYLPFHVMEGRGRRLIKAIVAPRSGLPRRTLGEAFPVLKTPNVPDEED